MDDPLGNLNRPAIQDARRRLVYGEDIITVSCATGLQVDFVSCLCIQELTHAAASHANLTRVSPFFRFSSSYCNLISKHFGGYPRCVQLPS
jgi:hypothetical protein